MTVPVPEPDTHDPLTDGEYTQWHQRKDALVAQMTSLGFTPEPHEGRSDGPHWVRGSLRVYIGNMHRYSPYRYEATAWAAWLDPAERFVADLLELRADERRVIGEPLDAEAILHDWQMTAWEDLLWFMPDQMVGFTAADALSLIRYTLQRARSTAPLTATADTAPEGGERRQEPLTLAELEALPVGSVVLDRLGRVWQMSPARWWFYGAMTREVAQLLSQFGPVRLLHRGAN